MTVTIYLFDLGTCKFEQGKMVSIDRNEKVKKGRKVLLVSTVSVKWPN